MLTAGRHEPVLLRESVELLGLEPGMRVVDATVGCGGHAEAILGRISPGGVLVGFEWDGEALEIARERLRRPGWDARLHRRNFREFGDALREEGLPEVDAVLFDLGVSSVQLDEGGRGFSFLEDGPLDMRMDRRRVETAAGLLARRGERELARILRELGEERFSRPIARAIASEAGRIGTTRGLAELVRRVYARRGTRGERGARIDPATRTFQALRIAVNDELGNIEAALPQAIGALRRGGRIAVVSFHSLEDRIVKEAFRSAARGCVCPPAFPVCCCGKAPEATVLTAKPVRPSPEEIVRNPRARSARLRAAEKL